MNERVKELAEQAGFKVNWQHEDVQAIKMARFEKFAELIVQECIDQVEVFNVRMDARPRDIVEAIQQHFGIER